MKTTTQIAEEAARTLLAEHAIQHEFLGNEAAIASLGWEMGEVGRLTYEEALRGLVRHAIEIDRAQRDMYELIAEALDDRVTGLHDAEYPEATERRKRAVAKIRNQDGDSLWCDHIGPMLDDIEEDLGKP